MAGGRTKYSETQRQHAMGALMASAVWDHEREEWRPQFRNVARDVEIPRSTLLRWWQGRDVSQDRTLRDASSRAGDEVRAEGAGDWLRNFYEQARDALAWVAEPERREPVTMTDQHGRPVVVQPAARVDQMTRALSDGIKLAAELDQRLRSDDASDERASRIAAIRARAKAAGIE